MEALIVCDTLCLSRHRLVEQLQKVQQQRQHFVFRWATAEETTVVLSRTNTKILPLVLVGDAYFVGVPSRDELYRWILSLEA